MAKTLTAEEIKAKKMAVKEARDAAKTEFIDWCKENGEKRDTKPSDSKKAKKWEKYKGNYDAQVKALESLKEMEAAAPKEKKERALKYDYPAGLDSAGKKEFRTKARAAAKKAAKDAEKGEGKKSEKKGDKKSEKKADAKKGEEKKSEKGKDKKSEKSGKSKTPPPPADADDDDDED